MLKELEVWTVLFPQVNSDILSPFPAGRAASSTLEPSIREARADAFAFSKIQAIYTPAILIAPKPRLSPSTDPFVAWDTASAAQDTALLPVSPTPPHPTTALIPGTMLLESLHLICFCGRPASCAHHLVLEIKATDMETGGCCLREGPALDSQGGACSSPGSSSGAQQAVLLTVV